MRVTKHILPNHLTLLATPMHSTEAVTVLVMVRTGSRYETRRTNGISHFLEHMMFKGTERRPMPIDVSRELDGVGAEFNAFTAKNTTGFYVRVSRQHLALAVDILSDILLHSLFLAEELDRERSVIVEEINMYEDNPSMMLDDIFEEHLFAGSSLGWHIAGGKDNIKKLIARSDILRYYQTHYTSRRMVVSIAGAIEERGLKAVKQAFAPLQSAPNPKQFRPWDKRLPRARVRLRWKETQQIHLALGSSAYPLEDRRTPALRVLATVLGGNMSSRLFTSIREERGLAYMIRAGANAYEDTGSFMVQAGVDQGRLRESLKVILDELKKVREYHVTREELHRAKEYIRGKTLLGLEDSESIAQWYGGQWLLSHTLKTPEQRLKKLLAVTAADVRHVAREILESHRLRLSLIGPFKNPKPFERLMRR